MVVTQPDCLGINRAAVKMGDGSRLRYSDAVLPDRTDRSIAIHSSFLSRAGLSDLSSPIFIVI